MNEMMKVFESEQFGQIRTVVRNGEPFFVGKDVAEILGYSNTRKALSDHVDDEDKLDGVTIRDSIGREQSPVFINESGLYSLILRSKLPAVKRFKRWITHDVIPSIRKHGAYATPETIDKILSDPDFGIRLLTELKTEREKNAKLQIAVQQKDKEIEEAKPKVSYYDRVLMSEEAVPITSIAKDYGLTAQKMNALLHKNGIQYSCGGMWVLYDKYADEGYTKSITFFDNYGRARMANYWTQKGRMFLYERLKSIGVNPVC